MEEVLKTLEAAGISLGTLVAGVFGGVVSLSFKHNLSPGKFILTVVAGAITAAYLTPLIAVYLDLGSKAENATAFVIGVVGMNLIAGLFKLSEQFKNAPIKTVQKIRGKKDD